MCNLLNPYLLTVCCQYPLINYPVMEELCWFDEFFVSFSEVPRIASAASLNDICAPKVDEAAIQIKMLSNCSFHIFWGAMLTFGKRLKLAWSQKVILKLVVPQKKCGKLVITIFNFSTKVKNFEDRDLTHFFRKR